jgi:CheY-like chemotaxis protein
MSASNSTILVVEDEALIALSLESQLQDMGYDTVVASTIEEARLALAQGSFGLVILDYKLGDQRTSVLAEGLRSARIPFIVCSGSQFHDVAAAFEGAPLVPKPYTDDLLRSAVTSALAAH